MSYSALGSFGFGQDPLCPPDPDGTQYIYNPITQLCDPAGVACPPDPDGTQYIFNPETKKCEAILGPGVACLPDPDGTQYIYSPVTKKCEPVKAAEMTLGTKAAIVGGIVALGLLVAYA